MALFHCDHCSHQQLLDDAFLHRWARCPECQHVGMVTANDDVFTEDLSGVQSWTSGWRSFAFLFASGLISFWATCVWVNSPVSDYGPRVAESVVDPKIEQHTDLLTTASFKVLVPNRLTSPADAQVSVGQRPLSNRASDVTQLVSLVLHPNDDRETPANVVTVPLPADVQPRIVPDSLVAARPESKVDGIQAAVAVPKMAVEADAANVPLNNAPKFTKVAALELPHDQKEQLQPLAEPPKSVSHEIAKSEGQQLFEHVWADHDPLAGKGDGLGPVFNARSCVECHFQGGCGGSGSNKHNVQVFEVLPDQAGGPMLGGVIHADGIGSQAMETKNHLELLLGSPKVPFRTIDPNPKKTRIIEIDAVRTVFLNTPPLWGNGLIDKIAPRELQKLEYTHPSTGRFHLLADGRIGKFGWKAQIASLHQFVGSACAAELGLSNSVRSQQKPMQYHDDSMSGRDLNDEQLKALVRYVGDLPVPRQVIPGSAEGRKGVAAGERLFNSIGCANCHVRDVGVAHGVYSDFRLHNIASALTKSETYYVFDAVPIYPPDVRVPKLSEWKTPPLWGLADTAPYWHDGSAHTIREAILKHDGEAAIVKAEYAMLTSEQESWLLSFLGTLKAPAAEPLSATQDASH